MSVTMICPNLKCGQTIVAPANARGKVVRCAHCQSLFMVPQDATASPGGKGSKEESAKAEQ